MIRALGRSLGPIREGRRSQPSTSLPVKGEIAGVNTASLGGYLHSTKTRARWAELELNGHVFDLERDGLRQVVLCPRFTMRCQHTTIPYRISRRPGQQGPHLPPFTRTSAKCATGASSKIRRIDNIIIGTWNTKSFRETPGTNTRNGQVQMEHPWTLK